MTTLEQAVNLRHGAILHHTVLTQGSGPYRVRVTGKCQTWKTRPGEFCLPVKHGLRDSGSISHETAANWVVA